MWETTGWLADRWETPVFFSGQQLAIQISEAERHLPREGNERVMKTAMKRIASELWESEEAQDLTEYALLVVLVGLGSILAMGSLASAISDAFSKAAANMTHGT
jgi:Flp pilus assembly pilin Flp